MTPDDIILKLKDIERRQTRQFFIALFIGILANIVVNVFVNSKK